MIRVFLGGGLFTNYDGNGNILQYDRNGAETTSAMDALRYNYNRDSQGNLVNNRLKHIKDATPVGNYTVDIDDQPDNNYIYDNIGNLISDTKTLKFINLNGPKIRGAYIGSSVLTVSTKLRLKLMTLFLNNVNSEGKSTSRCTQ